MGDWDDDLKRYENRRRHGLIRAERLAAARAIGTHTKEEWSALHDLFGRCVSCGVPYEYLNGNSATKDHIVPLCAGGCDCLANLQPVCRSCNSSGVSEDLRESALPGWQSMFLSALQGLNATS